MALRLPVHSDSSSRAFRAALLVLLVGLLAYALSPMAADVQPDTTKWTPELTMQSDQITDSEIFRDGKHVAYVVREAVMDKTTSEFRQHIHVVAVDGSFDVQCTRGEHVPIGRDRRGGQFSHTEHSVLDE